MKQYAQSIDQTVSPFCDGVLSESESEEVVEVINPSNGERCLFIPSGCESDVNRAVTSARRVFDEGHWSESLPSFRKKLLHHFADLIARDQTALDALDAGEMGKPISVRFASAAAASELMRFYAEAVDKIVGDLYSSDRSSFVAQRRLPRGVVAAVVPWNFPTYVAVLKIAPALAAGNCVILKPSELSSRSAMRLAHLAVEAGLPPGVLNVVPGRGESVGRALGLHNGVDMVTFTGSTDVGKQMLQYAGQSNMKVVVAECGGKSPHIVLGGVDLDDVADAIARSLVTNQGQICSAGSRLLVQQSIEKELLDRVIVRLKGVVIGDALDPRTTFGPLASVKQCARVMQYIDTARADGAELVAGGRRVLSESAGYFVEPTIFRRVLPSSRLAQEEVFGPVLAVITFEDEQQAIRIANDTIYGLAAYVWTTDLSVGMRMAKAVRSSAWINAAPRKGEGAGHCAAYEPAGQSGVGLEGGLAGMESFLRRQVVWITHA